MRILVEDYSKTINKVQVLENINLNFESGKIYGIKGKNGSGKTMLLRALCGLIRSTKGKVNIDDKEIGKDISFPESIGILIENPGFLPGLSGYKNLRMLADIKGIASDDKISEMIREVGLEGAEKKKFGKYSLGMKQKLAIAAAFMEDAQLILLDEPTNALDTKSVEMLNELMKIAKQRGALVIFTSHDDKELEELSDEIIYMENGRIVK